jgi:hypothetical protein
VSRPSIDWPVVPDARLDDLQDFGELLGAPLRGYFLEDAALEQPIANRADALHFHAVAGAERALRLDGGKIDGAPGVAGGVHVGDVVAGDLEAELLAERARAAIVRLV